MSFLRPQLAPKSNFRPQRDTLWTWLSTPKKRIDLNPYHLPGLFHTYNLGAYISGVCAILILEGGAAFWSISQGVWWVALVAALIIDFVLAYVSHLFQASICFNRNKLMVVSLAVSDPNEQARQRARLERDLGWRTFWQKVFYLLILVDAGFKCWCFHQAYPFIDAVGLLVVICYIIGGILHISCTGNVLYSVWFSLKWHRDHNLYLDSPTDVNVSFSSVRIERPLDSKFTFKSAVAGNHSIQQKDGSAVFTTMGVLTDDEIRNLLNAQEDSGSRWHLATFLLHHQLTFL
jgi:hypothetical protein